MNYFQDTDYCGWQDTDVRLWKLNEVATSTIKIWTNPDYSVSLGLLRDDLAVKQMNIIETIYLPNNAGQLKITDSNIDISQYLTTKLGSLSIIESGGFRIEETPEHNTLEITETNFEITEVGNNLTVKPKSTTRTLKQVWR